MVGSSNLSGVTKLLTEEKEMKSILKMMAVSLAGIARQSKVNEASLREDAEEYEYCMGIPADRRVKVLMGGYYTEEQTLRLLKRLSSARSRANQEHRSRTHLCRKEARAVHLARMYLKGTPYKLVEEKRYSEPNWDRIEELVGMVSVPLIPAPKENSTPNDNNLIYTSFYNWRMGN